MAARGVNRMVEHVFAGRVLPFDSGAAGRYAELAASRAASGRIVTPLDMQIAAIALFRAAPVVTRNARDFDYGGLDVIDPWA